MKTPMVTRTIQHTEVTLLCLNVESGEPFAKTLTLPRTYADEDTILKVAAPIVRAENDAHRAVSVSKVEVGEHLYGMTEQEFIANAKIIERKPKETPKNSTNE